ncbi:hypothetical protein ES703_69256 [subsurface metagenome]
MTLDEAIEIKGRTGEEFLHTDPDEIDEADRLSIEALKRLKSVRSVVTFPYTALLPGETKD